MMQLIQRVIDMKLMIQWAVTSSALILIVLGVRYLFREKLSARLKYALWGIVLLRLLVPFQVELPAAAPLPVLASNLAQEVTPRLDDTMLYAIPTEEQPYGLPAGMPPEYIRNGPFDSAWDRFSGGTVYDGEHVTRYAFMMSALEVVVLIWIAGTALAALVILLSNLHFALRLKKRRERIPAGGQCPPLQDAPIPVYVAEGLPSPCLFGVFRPAVYVTPRAAEHPNTLRHVLAHELTHYAHKDHIWSLLRILALALHWYNPLVWLAVALSKRDGELACDEGAVARLGEGERIPYGRTLVDMVAKRSPRPADLLSCSTAMTGGKKSIQLRVAQIVKRPETVKTALFAAIALVALSSVFVFAGRAEQQENKPLLNYLSRTTAVRYSPPTYSSQIYPDPITDEDLLAEAKEFLSGFRYLEDGDPQPDLNTKELIHESRIALTFEGGEMEYSLLWQNDYTYLFPGSIWKQAVDLQEEEGETAQLVGVSGTCISQPGDDVISALKSLARRQNRRLWSASTPEDPGFSQYRARLEAAQGIWRNSTMLHNGRVITDSAQLERARELLVLEPLTEKEDSRTWDGVWNATISFTSAPPDADWTGSGDCFYYISFEDGGIYVVSPSIGYMSTITGSYVGRIPEDNWNAVDELFENAPTVDDRQHMAGLEENQAAVSQAMAKALEGCERLRFESGVYPDITDPALLEQAKTVLTSGYLIDDMAQTGDGGDNETVELRGRDGQSLSSFLITNQVIRQQLHDITLNQQAQSLLGGLTQEQVDRANEAFAEFVEVSPGVYASSEISCFFTSNYDDPTQIDLEEFLRYCPIGTGDCLGEEDTEEFLAVMAQDNIWVDPERELHSPYDLLVPVHRYPRAEVSALLQKYAGVTVEELNWEGCLYVKEYDAFYNFTSDAGPGFFPCAGGQIMEDSVLLWSKPGENGDRCELVLRKDGSRWLIQSHHTIYER